MGVDIQDGAKIQRSHTNNWFGTNPYGGVRVTVDRRTKNKAAVLIDIGRQVRAAAGEANS
jgi:hypothetical protein